MTAALAQLPRYITGYDRRDGELHAWYKPVGGSARWIDNDQLVPPVILKGNEDLVGTGVWEADFEARR